MSTSESQVALPQIQEFYFTLDKVNTWYQKAKVDGEDFHLWLSHIVVVLRVVDEGTKTYFDKIRATNFLETYLEVDEFVGTVLALGTRFTNPMRAIELTWLVFMFQKILSPNILPQVGHLNELSTYVVYTL